MKKSPILFSLVAIIILSSTLYGSSSTPPEENTTQEIFTKPIAFDQAKGIYFEYLDYMKCTYDDEDTKEGHTSWDITGASIMIQVSCIELGFKDTLILLLFPSFLQKHFLKVDYLNEGITRMRASYQSSGFDVEKDKIATLQYNNTPIKGTLIKVDTLKGVKFIQEIYIFSNSMTMTFITLSDYREKLDQPTEEFFVMKKLFSESLKLSEGAKPMNRTISAAKTKNMEKHIHTRVS